MMCEMQCVVRRAGLKAFVCGLLVCWFLSGSGSQQGVGILTTRLLTPDGEQLNGWTHNIALSEDGRWLALVTEASNLIRKDASGLRDVYLVDRESGDVKRLTFGYDGLEANAPCETHVSMSSDGRIVAFASRATNILPLRRQYAGNVQVYAYDRARDKVVRVSATPSGEEGDGSSREPAVSPDGRYVAFASRTTNLVAGDNILNSDVLLHDLWTRETRKVTYSYSGGHIDGDAYPVAVSGEGRYVLFYSTATNLVPNDTNGDGDGFVRDMWTGTTRRVTVGSFGEEAELGGAPTAMSHDGNVVLFTSSSRNLPEWDPLAPYRAFTHDLRTGITTLLRIAPNPTVNTIAPARGTMPMYLAPDGRWAIVRQRITEMNAVEFLYDIETGSTRLISVGADGASPNRGGGTVVATRNGMLVAFVSSADTLVRGDTNGKPDVFFHELTNTFPVYPTAVVTAENCRGWEILYDLIWGRYPSSETWSSHAPGSLVVAGQAPEGRLTSIAMIVLFEARNALLEVAAFDFRRQQWVVLSQGLYQENGNRNPLDLHRLTFTFHGQDAQRFVEPQNRVLLLRCRFAHPQPWQLHGSWLGLSAIRWLATVAPE